MSTSRFVLSACVCLWIAPYAHGDGIYGFTDDHAAEHRELEERYETLLDKNNIRDWSKRMTVRPHHLGSPQAKANAEFIAQQFRSWGYETEIEVYEVLFPTPKTRALELLEPTRFTARLAEQVAEEDSAFAQIKAEGLPPFNAYSADGDVTGDLVYVHYGIPEDYEELERRGIDVRGKLVIARYGGSWRGIKPKVAAEKGAIGCLIYNDPADDGFALGDAYPEGSFKHPSAVQRGSVIDLPVRPGDPLTPAYGAIAGARRLAISEAETIMKIPVLPISYEDALPLFEAMEGPLAPASWRGAMPVTYRLGGDGAMKVHLRLEFNWDTVPAYNVIGKLRGSERPNQWVIRGNHHDAWVIGARDPMSGLAPLMEQARVIGELARQGWRPKRTIVFCAWDGEEPGLLGSTEWAEHHAKELREKAVTYINTDGNSRGFLRMAGSHSLETMAAEVAHDVIDPQTRVSVSERARAAMRVRGSEEQKIRAKNEEDMRLGALGSGSDYSPFLQHLGVPSLNVSFGGEGTSGAYHTMFDTFDHFAEFVDPGFEYGRALAEVCGRLTLRIADADVVPFDFTGTHRAIEEYVAEVVKLADEKREETEEERDLIEDGVYVLAADPTKTYVPPHAKAPVPHLNFAPILNALDRFGAASTRLDTGLQEFLEGNAKLSKRQRSKLDRLLYTTEQAYIHEAGLPRRPWFRHQIYAPGFYTGYGVKTLPGVREGIEERKWEETAEQIDQTAGAIERAGQKLDEAAELLEAAGRLDLP